MSLKTGFMAAMSAISLTAAGSALAGDILVMDPYARSATAHSASGAAFMGLANHGDQDDRLIAAHSEIAERVELHTHVENEQGVMQMREVEGGIVLPAGGTHMLKRGGDHVMFMGLKQALEEGDRVTVTLTFEKAGDMVVEIPVELNRVPAQGGMEHKHGG